MVLVCDPCPLVCVDGVNEGGQREDTQSTENQLKVLKQLQPAKYTEHNDLVLDYGFLLETHLNDSLCFITRRVLL